jgi:hypothetical protein
MILTATYQFFKDQQLPIYSPKIRIHTHSYLPNLHESVFIHTATYPILQVYQLSYTQQPINSSRITIHTHNNLPVPSRSSLQLSTNSSSVITWTHCFLPVLQGLALMHTANFRLFKFIAHTHSYLPILQGSALIHRAIYWFVEDQHSYTDSNLQVI